MVAEPRFALEARIGGGHDCTRAIFVTALCNDHREGRLAHREAVRICAAFVEEAVGRDRGRFGRGEVALGLRDSRSKDADRSELRQVAGIDRSRIEQRPVDRTPSELQIAFLHGLLGDSKGEVQARGARASVLGGEQGDP